jgi:23S rRNA (uracil1939-C5)-methyltransferase
LADKGVEKTGTDGLTLQIEKLVAGGAGLGFLDGAPVFVPLSAPGDEIVLRGSRRKKGTVFAEVGQLKTASTERREPPCRWYGSCGGCDWMHLSRDAQLNWKKEILLESLARIGKVNWDSDVKMTASPSEAGWRHRARLQFARGKAGFFRRGSHTPVEWERCLVLAESLNIQVAALRPVLANNPAARGSVQLAASPADDRATMAWQPAGDSFPPGEMMDLAQGACQQAGISVAGQAVTDRKGRVVAASGGPLSFRTDEIETQASAGGFFQANALLNPALVSRVVELMKMTGAQTVLDLFCGNGNFGRPAAGSGLAVTGVEGSPVSAADAARPGQPGFRVVTDDVLSYLVNSGSKRFDAVIMDPPRTGLPPGAAGLLAKMSGAFIYVSCDPATLARDVRLLADQGCRLTSLELFEMFPNSSHSEAVAILEAQ